MTPLLYPWHRTSAVLEPPRWVAAEDGPTWIEEPRHVFPPGSTRAKRFGHAIPATLVFVVWASAMAGVAFIGQGDDARTAETERVLGARVSAVTPVPSTVGLLEVKREVLGVGSVGEDVKVVQQRLAELGYDPGSFDGHFGATTEAAVTAFQRAAELRADGVVGPKTWSVLDHGLSAP